MELGLQDKRVLVTGGSSGIGKEAALAFAREGARVAITYNSRKEAADAVVDALGTDAFAVPMDLGTPESIADAVGQTIERFGGLDVLVGNAVNWGDAAPHELPRRIEDA